MIRFQLAVLLAVMLAFAVFAALARDADAATFGFNDAWHRLGPEEIGAADGADATTNRIPFSYEAYANSASHRADIANRVSAMNTLGMQPHLVPAVATAYVQADYNAVVQDLATTFDGQIRGIEIMNEPNGFLGGDMPVGQYIAAFNSARHAIHQVEPGMTIISAGLAPVGNWAWYLKQISRESGAFKLGAHIYPRGTGSSGPKARAAMDDIVVPAATVDNKDRDVWITETGISSGEYSESAQATRLVSTIGAFTEYSRVKAIIVHRLKDDPTYFPGNEWENGLGVLRADGTAKPAYAALADGTWYARHRHKNGRRR